MKVARDLLAWSKGLGAYEPCKHRFSCIHAFECRLLLAKAEINLDQGRWVSVATPVRWAVQA